jgi:cytochrome b
MQILPPRLPQLSEIGRLRLSDKRAVTVWDLPLRLFHWSLLLLFLIAYATGNRVQYYGVHEAAGIAVFGLLIFRAIWGFTGNGAARFSSFLRGPRAVLAHVRQLLHGHAEPAPGHNPLGGWAVVVMLVLLLVESVSGLLSSTFDYAGPLAPLVSDTWADRMATIHVVNLDLLFVMIGLHLLGITVTSILGRENLVASMIHGRKHLAAATGASAQSSSWVRAAIAVIAAAAIVGGLLFLGHLIA